MRSMVASCEKNMIKKSDPAPANFLSGAFAGKSPEFSSAAAAAAGAAVEGAEGSPAESAAMLLQAIELDILNMIKPKREIHEKDKTKIKPLYSMRKANQWGQAPGTGDRSSLHIIPMYFLTLLRLLTWVLHWALQPLLDAAAGPALGLTAVPRCRPPECYLIPI